MTYQWTPVTVRGLSERDLDIFTDDYPSVLDSNDPPLVQVNGVRQMTRLAFVGRTEANAIVAVFSYECHAFPQPRTSLGYFAFWQDLSDSGWHQLEEGLVHSNPAVTGYADIPLSQELEVASRLIAKIAADHQDQLDTTADVL